MRTLKITLALSLIISLAACASVFSGGMEIVSGTVSTAGKAVHTVGKVTKKTVHAVAGDKKKNEPAPEPAS